MEIEMKNVWITSPKEGIYKIVCKSDGDGVNMSANAQELENIYPLSYNELKDVIAAYNLSETKDFDKFLDLITKK